MQCPTDFALKCLMSLTFRPFLSNQYNTSTQSLQLIVRIDAPEELLPLAIFPCRRELVRSVTILESCSLDAVNISDRELSRLSPGEQTVIRLLASCCEVIHRKRKFFACAQKGSQFSGCDEIHSQSFEHYPTGWT